MNIPENKASTFDRILEKIKSHQNLMQVEHAYKKVLEKEKEYQEKEDFQRFIEKLENSGLTMQDFKENTNFKFLRFYYLSNGKTKHTKAIANQVLNWWKEKRRQKPFLVLFGEKGTGKTRVAKRLALLALKEKHLNLFYTDKKQIDKKIYDFDTKQEFLDFLMEVKLLVIDDLLTGYSSEFSFAQIYTVLDHRYQQRKLTILTMNEDIRRYRNQQKYEDINLLADRLEEVAEFVHFDYPSLRSSKYLEYAKKGDIRPIQKGDSSHTYKDF